jgi:transposase-like protein
MSLLILPNFMKKRHPNAFTGRLDCPRCKGHYPDYDGKKQKWKFDRQVTPTRNRYICKHCGQAVQYDFTHE